MAAWKLGTTSDLYLDSNWQATLVSEEAAVEMLAKTGFDALDFGVFEHQGKTGRFWGTDYLDKAKSIAEAAQKAGIEFSQAHAPMFDYAAPDSAAMFDLTLRSFEIAKVLGAPYLVIHPQFLPGAIYGRRHNEQLEYNLSFYRSFLDISAKTGVKIALENMYGHDPQTDANCPTYFSLMDEILEFLDCTEGREQFVVCLDTGHAHIIGKESVSDCIRKLDTDLKLLHIHDNFGDKDSHMPPCHGNIDWKDTVHALREIGYTGALSLEAQNLSLRYPISDLALRQKSVELCYQSLKHISEL